MKNFKSIFILQIFFTVFVLSCKKNPTLFEADKTLKKANINDKLSLNLLPMPNLKGQNTLSPGVERYKLLVKFSPDFILDFSDQKKPMIASDKLLSLQITAEQQAIVSRMNALHYKQAIPFSVAEKASFRNAVIPKLASGKFNIYKFRGWAYVEEALKMSGSQVLQLANDLEKLPFVEYAVVEADIEIPPPSATPDFASNQHYRSAGNSIIPLIPSTNSNQKGIDAEFAWSIGIKGQGVRVADIEHNANFDHEDLSSPKFKYIVGEATSTYLSHGTGVLGVVGATDNGFGMKGMVHEADSFLFVREPTFGRPAGIAMGLTHLRAGDVFMYEMQTWGPNPKYIPADYNQAVWDVTNEASNAGIIIVAAAGNGGQNLDGPEYAAYNARGDNGSIIVGAGSPQQVRTYFSTYGSRVDLQGWGDWTVATTGGDGLLYNGGANQDYTGSFSGTSAATPIVASAVVAVQSWYKQNNNGNVLSPTDMRSLLINTGTYPASGDLSIGPLPNIRAAILSLTTSLPLGLSLKK
ncbi:S8 family serine peptidase [Pedobacter endophyticus]|uniref:S8 family serine peptidase n=1 Tax=Pedobacter endophyticus TaxID=2789740 RepID=A0A7U3SQ95_9SPHI|nr:S8 family serine peptidase [Pedobacter endophyticus]QPH38871.1 S8 family serine peptidase [Pedobacter endophyticus]